jgi:repressor of nif and glnA expression
VAIGSDSLDVERKTIAMLRVLYESPELLGARIITRQLKDDGVDLT